MSVFDKLKGAVGLDADTETKKHYRCTECDNEFDSYKVQERAFCDECMANDVEVVERR